MLLLATGASAQTSKSAAVYAGKLDITPVSVVKKAKAPMKKEGEAKLSLLGYEPTEESAAIWGPSSDFESSSMVASQITGGKLINFEELKGYKIVGFQFALLASLGEKAGLVCGVFSDEKNIAQEMSTALPVDGYTLSELNGNQLNLKYNALKFTSSYTITGEEYAFLYGFAYGNTLEENPFILAQTSDATCVDDLWLVTGKPTADGYDESIYSMNNPDESVFSFPLMNLVLEAPNGETVILGVDGSQNPVVMQYYSLDGKKLSAPQKGINVVKMSDGTSKKVLVK